MSRAGAWVARLRNVTRLFCLSLAMSAVGVSGLMAQTGANVLVVLNENSPASQQIAAHYTEVRAVPSGQVVRLKVAVNDEVSRAVYEQQIEAPIAHWLARNQAQDRILYIVLTKGVPLRIQGSAGRSGTQGSVDSELTLLYRKMTGGSVSSIGSVPNPYHLGDRPVTAAVPFTHRTQDIYLVARLDGFTVDDVIGLIDRAVAPSTDGRILLDGKAAIEDTGNTWLREAADRLVAAGWKDRIALDESSRILTAENGVIGYYSWGSTDPAVRERRPGLQVVPGAIAGTYVSTDARTFAEPPADWKLGDWNVRTSFYAGSPQSLTGDLIREGFTGVSGYVAEPYLDGTVRPQILFPAYVAGFSLAEAFYLALPTLSWQSVVVGDPLCRVFPRSAAIPDPIDKGLDDVTETPALFAGRRMLNLASGGTPTSALQALLRGESRGDRGDADGARVALEEAVKLDPRLVPAQSRLALIAEERREYGRAVECYRQILAVNPNHVAVLNNLAYAMAVRQNKPGDALPFAERAYTLSPNLPAARASVADTLGWIHYLMGNRREAAQLIAEALAGIPGSAEVHLHAAAVLADAGNLEQARTELATALKLDPALEARDEVARLRARLKD